MRPLAMILLIAACSSPSPGFMGTEASRQVVEGWTIDVYRKDEDAEAIRLTDAWGARAEDMARRGLIAVALATGCEDLDLQGDPDPAVIRVKVNCE